MKNWLLEQSRKAKVAWFVVFGLAGLYGFEVTPKLSKQPQCCCKCVNCECENCDCCKPCRPLLNIETPKHNVEVKPGCNSGKCKK